MPDINNGLRSPVTHPWITYQVKFNFLSAVPKRIDIIGQYASLEEAEAAQRIVVEELEEPAYILRLPDPDAPAPPEKEGWIRWRLRTMFNLPAPPLEYQYEAAE